MIDYPLIPSGEKPIWDGNCFHLDKRKVRVLKYSSNLIGWDDDLTAFHEVEAGNGQHPIDIASRNRAIEELQYHGFPSDGSILEIGCSSGYLLQDIRKAFPKSEIVGADVVLKPLERLGKSLLNIPLLQFDILQCPLKESQFDAVVALNVLEHIEDDLTALKKIALLLKPGGILILEVPYGPGLYDYYDIYLKHFRRYSKRNLLTKIIESGLQIDKTDFLGFIPYLPFFVAKKINRIRFGVKGNKSFKFEKMVRKEIKKTASSRVLELAMSTENILRGKVTFPFGIRLTAVLRKTN